MAYCHECGEQIAENDTFCPYCGISLQPITVAGDEEDDSFSKTIVVQKPEIAAQKSSVNESKLVEEIAPALKSDAPLIKERLGVDNTAKKINDFSNDAKSDNVNSKPESVEIPSATDNYAVEIGNLEIEKTDLDEIQETTPVSGGNLQESNLSQDDKNFVDNSEIPTPKILETSDTEAESRELKTPEANLQAVESSEIKDIEDINLEPVFVSTEKEVVEDEAIKIDSPSNSQTESSLMAYEEADVKEVLSTDEPESLVDEEISKIEESKVSQSNRVDLGVFTLKEESSAFAAENETASSETPVIAEHPIAMPEAELSVEENCPPSRFDSVSIMEKPEATEETPKENLAERFIQSEEKPLIAEDNPKERKEARSFTTPNIGGGDTDGKSKTKLKPLDEGTVLNGRYEIIRKIGGGGMGAVYLASDKNLGGVLRAVKEMVQSYIENEQQEKAVNDFKRESLLLTSLDHQSIPTIYDYFFDETEARFYLVMKYIAGGDLSGRLRSAPEGRIDETSVTQWAIQVVDVLDYLHNRQPPIIYRDLKPANIMVDGNSGRVMLIDFGIARWVNKEEKGVTAVGTMGYAPPELFSGNVEARSDIYSLGSTMFHLLTGADPQSNPLLIFDFQKHPRPRQINPQLSDQMERILMRTVEYSADKRFGSAAELRKTLEEHLENLKAGRVTFGVKEAPVSVALSDQPVFCGFCGQKIVATDMFCAFCGAKQPLAQQGVHSESYAPTPLTAQLLIIGTNELEQPAFRLEKEDNLVGRRDPQSNIFPEVDLSKFDPQTKISRRHARIWRSGSEFMVEDLGSSNGTYLLPAVSDTMRLQPHQPQLLTNGDKIKLGDTTLHFILG